VPRRTRRSRRRRAAPISTTTRQDPGQRDKCPEPGEDFNGFQDDGRCPDATSIPMATRSRTPRTSAPSSRGFNRLPGRGRLRPDATLDTDGDKIPDAKDKCLHPGGDPSTGFETDDGCPDVKPAARPTRPATASPTAWTSAPDHRRQGRLRGRRRLPRPRAQGDGGQGKRFRDHLSKSWFEPSKDKLQEPSRSLLDAVASVLKTHPNIKLCAFLEGQHRTGVGPAKLNLDLSSGAPSRCCATWWARASTRPGWSPQGFRGRPPIDR